MKIKHFIVTYDNEQRINDSLNSLFASNSDFNSLEVFVINNHSRLQIRDEFAGRIKIINNQTRPDFSTGHLSRNWNEAIINGFKDLNNPDCDILITSQDDTIFEKNYLEKSIELSKNFDFVSFGTGDQFIIYSPNAVKRIGLWDERFCNIGYQEADYFLRAVRYHHQRSSLNDYIHGRVHQAQDEGIKPIRNTISGFDSNDPAHMRSMPYHPHSAKIFQNKWRTRPHPWGEDHVNMIKQIEPQMESFILYPYFEKDVETLREQKYLICE